MGCYLGDMRYEEINRSVGFCMIAGWTAWETVVGKVSNIVVYTVNAVDENGHVTVFTLFVFHWIHGRQGIAICARSAKYGNALIFA